MYRISEKKVLNPSVIHLKVEAPLVARAAKPGQFVILRPDENSERIPLTIAGSSKESGEIEIIFQRVGATTERLARLGEGDFIADLVGPLGKPTELSGISRALIVGGGVGCAIALPIARALHDSGCEVISVIGFRGSELVILEDEFRAVSSALTVMTDDGSHGREGNVTLPVAEMLKAGEHFDMIIAIGPLVMMKYVTKTAEPYGVPVTVSMNPIMIDGTGMCGGCRLTLIKDGKRVTKFACVDGPDFNGYEVDFDEAMQRSRMYFDFERHAHSEECNLYKKEVGENGEA